MHGGLYCKAVQQARNIISLHSTSATDVGNFMGRSFENRNLEKGQEMINRQRYEMRTSLQLRLANGLIMDLVLLLHHWGEGGGHGEGSDVPPPLGILHGIYGGRRTYIGQRR